MHCQDGFLLRACDNKNAEMCFIGTVPKQIITRSCAQTAYPIGSVRSVGVKCTLQSHFHNKLRAGTKSRVVAETPCT